jgi:pimeloyl-ACP methyl ester carboxylesterase
LGFHYCLQHPDRVIAHIFTNSISALTRPEVFDATKDRDKRIAMIRQFGQAGLQKMPFHPINARRLEPGVRQVLIDAANQVSPEAFIQLTGQTRPHLSVIDRVAEIDIPTLLVNGRWEKRFQPLRDEISTLMPGLQIADIEAGHAVNLEQHDAFNEAVLSFLRRLPGVQLS